MPKKATKKTVEKENKEPKKEKPIGEVVHFFSNISVAVIKLSAPLSIGDEIRITGGENTDFTQKVESMQIEHEKIAKAKAKSEAGLKVKEKVREGYKVFKA